jgi:hypothetical protein
MIASTVAPESVVSRTPVLTLFVLGLLWAVAMVGVSVALWAIHPLDMVRQAVDQALTSPLAAVIHPRVDRVGHITLMHPGLMVSGMVLAIVAMGSALAYSAREAQAGRLT